MMYSLFVEPFSVFNYYLYGLQVFQRVVHGVIAHGVVVLEVV